MKSLFLLLGAALIAPSLHATYDNPSSSSTDPRFECRNRLAVKVVEDSRTIVQWVEPIRVGGQNRMVRFQVSHEVADHTALRQGAVLAAEKALQQVLRIAPPGQSTYTLSIVQTHRQESRGGMSIQYQILVTRNGQAFSLVPVHVDFNLRTESCSAASIDVDTIQTLTGPTPTFPRLAAYPEPARSPNDLKREEPLILEATYALPVDYDLLTEGVDLAVSGAVNALVLRLAGEETLGGMLLKNADDVSRVQQDLKKAHVTHLVTVDTVDTYQVVLVTGAGRYSFIVRVQQSPATGRFTRHPIGDADQGGRDMELPHYFEIAPTLIKKSRTLNLGSAHDIFRRVSGGVLGRGPNGQ